MTAWPHAFWWQGTTRRAWPLRLECGLGAPIRAGDEAPTARASQGLVDGHHAPPTREASVW